MVQCKDECTEKDAGLFQSFFPEGVGDESPEEAFFQKRIDHDDIGEDEKEIVAVETFLGQELVPDAQQIDVFLQQQIKQDDPDIGKEYREDQLS